MLLDVANPLDASAGFPPTLAVKDTDSLAEQIQRAFPGPGASWCHSCGRSGGAT